MLSILFLLIVVGGGLAGAGVIGVAVYRAGQNRMAAAPTGRLSVGLMTLEPGDEVTHLGTPYTVVSAEAHADGGQTHRWYKLEGAGVTRWLWAQERDTTQAALLEHAPTLATTARPADTLTHGGRDYRLRVWGQAEVAADGGNHARSGEYFDYHGPGMWFLTLRTVGETYEGFEGRLAPRAAFDLLPGADSGSRIARPGIATANPQLTVPQDLANQLDEVEASAHHGD